MEDDTMPRQGHDPARRPESTGRRAATLLSMALAALLAAACTGGDRTDAAPSTGGSRTEAPSPARSDPIPQPIVTDLPVAPDSERVDLSMPSFSDPTNVTNPLFPISSQASVLLLGQVDDEAFRTEVTLLPETRIIEWVGQLVETRVSQYVAYLGGRLHEVAYDFYAQADDGSVWYFGEDVFNFEDGAIVDTHGTWIAGKDGPAAMIMPADPKLGDVYRPENIPGFVFEEVTVTSVDQMLDGPVGLVEGGLVITELHMDGATEDKSFAPGYGEFYTAGGGDVEALALAVPTDALSSPTPADLTTLETGAGDVFEAAGSEDWMAATGAVERMVAAWDHFSAGDVPTLIAPWMAEAVASLAEAVDAREPAVARQAAIDSARWSLDHQLRHRPQAEIDLARFDLWAAQILVDADAGDAAAVNGDFFALDYVRDRILHALDGADVTRINIQLEELLGAVGDQELSAVAESAADLRDTVAEIPPVG